MKLYRVLALSALVLLTTIGARADGASTGDARIIVGSGGDPINCGLPDFTFKSTGKGDGTLDCVNSSGEDWIGLTITGIAKIGKIDFGPGGLACDGKSFDPTNLFAGCKAVVKADPNNTQLEFVTVTFFDGEITAGEDFFINLNDDPKKNGKGGTKKSWIGSLEAIPEVVTVPEPGTMTFLLAGWGCLWFSRRRQTSKLKA